MPFDVLRRCAMAGLLAGAACGQSGPAPRFEVASVKRGGDVFSTRPERSRGRIRWTTQLAYLIGYAYGLDFSRVSGPRLGAVYAIEATFAPVVSDDDIRAMLRQLLADRFQMQSHRVTVEADGYELSVAGGGAKLKPAADGESYVSATAPAAGIIVMTGRNATTGELAVALARALDLPVWDRTGLRGRHDFALRFARDPSAGPETDAPFVATALRESLGLRIRKQKGPVESLVIDSIGEPAKN